MTHEQAKEQAERDVYFSNVGELMVMCDRRGFKYRENNKGMLSPSERSRCEQCLIKALTKEYLAG